MCVERKLIRTKINRRRGGIFVTVNKRGRVGVRNGKTEEKKS